MNDAPTSDVPKRSPGRPRRPEVDTAILGAAVDLVAELGFTEVTVEAVAARAGVGKATVYRRWPTRQDLMLAAATAAGGTFPAPDTGDIRADLVVLASAFVRQLKGTPAGALTADLVAEAARNPALRAELDAFLLARRRPWLEALAAASRRGQLRPDLDFELVVDLLVGAVLCRVLVRAVDIDPEVTEAIVDQALTGLLATDPSDEHGVASAP